MKWAVGSTALGGDQVPEPVSFFRAAEVVDANVPSFIEGHLFALRCSEVNMFVLGLKAAVNRAAGLREEFFEAYRSLSAPEVPEIDLAAFEFGLGPRHPDAHMVDVVWWIHFGQYVAVRRP